MRRKTNFYRSGEVLNTKAPCPLTPGYEVV